MFGQPKIPNLAKELAKISPRLIKTKPLVAGNWISSKNSLPVTHPGSGEAFINVGTCGKTEAEVAIKAAHTAFPAWSSRTMKERGQIIMKWYQLMEENKEDLARLMVLENGKPMAEAMGEMAYSNSFCEYYAHECRRLEGRTTPSPFTNTRIMTIRQPIGVCGMITPWNFPAAMITRKAAPALAVGCTVVLKPSEDTPLTALTMAQLAIDAGVPPECFSGRSQNEKIYLIFIYFNFTQIFRF